MKRRCVQCGEEVIGRSDKKFCCDSCRNAFNNSLNRDSKNLVRNINNRLRKNYRILEYLRKNPGVPLNKEKLEAKGFAFNFITGMRETEDLQPLIIVYDIGLILDSADNVALVDARELVFD